MFKVFFPILGTDKREVTVEIQQIYSFQSFLSFLSVKERLIEITERKPHFSTLGTNL